MTTNGSLMLRNMFFMNDDATRHFLAPSLPSIQACDIQQDYEQKKTIQGPITSSVTTTSTKLRNESTGMAPQVAKQRPHNCEECGKTFLMKHHLVTHMRVHTGERPHICTECGKSFALKHCLSTHLLLHMAERPYKCAECNKSFTLKHHLVSHERVHTRDRPFECKECGQRFPQKRHLSTHIKFHSGERPFSCQVCGESFSREEHLVMHSRFHGGLSPYNCPDCGAGFLRKFELVNHERQHGRNPESCPTCGKEFLQKRTLLVHIRSCGDNPHSYQQSTTPPGFAEETPPRFNGNSSPVYNEECSSQFNNSNSQRLLECANNQLNSYSEAQVRFSHGTSQLPQGSAQVKDKVCKECGETFASMEGLALHLRLHFGDHSFLADICSLAASLKQTAVNVAASLKKTHVCADCGRGFTQRHGLFQHRQRYANGSCKGKPHVCVKCGKSFAQRNHLSLHERQHMEHSTGSSGSKEDAPSSQEKNCIKDQQIETKLNSSSAGDDPLSLQMDNRHSMLIHRANQSQTNHLNGLGPNTSTNDNTLRTCQNNCEEMGTGHSHSDPNRHLHDISASDTTQSQSHKIINPGLTLMSHSGENHLLELTNNSESESSVKHHHLQPLPTKHY